MKRLTVIVIVNTLLASGLFFYYAVPVQASTSLKYFGYFGDPENGTSLAGPYKDYANLVWLGSNQYDTGICGVSPGNDKTCLIKAAVAHGQKVILALEVNLLFSTYPVGGYVNLCDPQIIPACIKDYIGNWNDYKQYIKPYVDDGSIVALYIIDEPLLYYGDPDYVRQGIYGTAYENLDLVTKLIKQDFPNLPLATTLLPSDIMKLPNFPSFSEPVGIPPGFDWLGFDCYGDWNNCYGSGISITQLHNALKAQLRPGQKMFLVPDAFLYVDANYKVGDTPSPSGVASLLTRVNNYYELAKNDPDVVAMFPYKWDNYDGLGHLTAKDIPQIAARYEQIGREIVPPILDFSISPQVVDSGSSATLSWKLSGGNVTSCSIAGSWGLLVQSDPQYLSKGLHTQTTGNLTENGTYTMQCTGSGGLTPLKSAMVQVKHENLLPATNNNGSSGSVQAGQPPVSQFSANFADGALINDKGTIYIIEHGKKRGFTSLQVMTGLGYKLSNVKKSDLSTVGSGEVISSTDTRHFRGSLVVFQGVVYFMGRHLRYAFPSAEVFVSWMNRWQDIIPANKYDLQLPLGPIVQKKT